MKIYNAILLAVLAVAAVPRGVDARRMRNLLGDGADDENETDTDGAGVDTDSDTGSYGTGGCDGHGKCDTHSYYSHTGTGSRTGTRSHTGTRTGSSHSGSSHTGSRSRSRSGSDTCGDCCETVPLYLEIYHKHLDAITEAGKICSGPDLLLLNAGAAQDDDDDDDDTPKAKKARKIAHFHKIIYKYPCILIYMQQIRQIRRSTLNAMQMISYLTDCYIPLYIIHRLERSELDEIMGTDDEEEVEEEGNGED